MDAQIGEINKQRHESVNADVRKAIAQILEEGGKVSFYSVAERAQISRSTLYRQSDLRSMVEAARNATMRAFEEGRQESINEHLLARIAALEEALVHERQLATTHHGESRSKQPFQYAVVRLDHAA